MVSSNFHYLKQHSCLPTDVRCLWRK